MKKEKKPEREYGRKMEWGEERGQREKEGRRQRKVHSHSSYTAHLDDNYLSHACNKGRIIFIMCNLLLLKAYCSISISIK